MGLRINYHQFETNFFCLGDWFFCCSSLWTLFFKFDKVSYSDKISIMGDLQTMPKMKNQIEYLVLWHKGLTTGLFQFWTFHIQNFPIQFFCIIFIFQAIDLNHLNHLIVFRKIRYFEKPLIQFFSFNNCSWSYAINDLLVC